MDAHAAAYRPGKERPAGDAHPGGYFRGPLRTWLEPKARDEKWRPNRHLRTHARARHSACGRCLTQSRRERKTPTVERSVGDAGWSASLRIPRDSQMEG